VTSSVTSPFESPPSLSYRLPIVTFLLAPLVFEIFDLKVADKHTNKQNSTLTDNKGPLKLSAREPITSLIHVSLLHTIIATTCLSWNGRIASVTRCTPTQADTFNENF